MSRKGNCWDNAVAESFFKTLKVEWINNHQYQNIEMVRKSIFDYIERWYNTKRKHSANRFLSPAQKHILLINRNVA
jgi:transposase InsO family protein